eukprot:402433-Rhodomonas_salina.1
MVFRTLRMTDRSQAALLSPRSGLVADAMWFLYSLKLCSSSFCAEPHSCCSYSSSSESELDAH